MEFVLNLSGRDLARFRHTLKKLRHSVRDAEEIDILDAAKSVTERLCLSRLQDCIARRFERVPELIAMLEDEAWGLPHPEREWLIAMLAYVGDDQDMIADDLHTLGLLDDAIMIQMVCDDLQDTIDAYRSFCQFRDRCKLGGVERMRALTAQRNRLLDSRRLAAAEGISPPLDSSGDG